MLSVVLALLTIAYLVLRKWLYVLWSRGVGELPPGPWPLPIIGDGLSIDAKEPFRTFEKWTKSYGRIYSVIMGNQLVIVLSDVELMKKAFKEDAFSGRPEDYWVLIWKSIGLPLGTFT